MGKGGVGDLPLGVGHLGDVFQEYCLSGIFTHTPAQVRGETHTLYTPAEAGC